MGDMEKAVQRVMRNAKELWVEMGLNSEQCAARMNHFTENIEAALDNLLRQVCFCFTKLQKTWEEDSQNTTTQEITERDAIRERLKQKQHAIGDICECLGLTPPPLVCFLITFKTTRNKHITSFSLPFPIGPKWINTYGS